MSEIIQFVPGLKIAQAQQEASREELVVMSKSLQGTRNEIMNRLIQAGIPSEHPPDKDSA